MPSPVTNFVFQLTPSRRATEQVPFGVYAVEFQLTPSRRATYKNTIFICQRTFQLTPSRRATLPLLLFRPTPGHFNSRPHGGRLSNHLHESCAVHFNSRPHGGRLGSHTDFSICHISTHALTEGDGGEPIFQNYMCHFNSRPHGGRQLPAILIMVPILFQLTPSRRATALHVLVVQVILYFNSRPHGGRPPRDGDTCVLVNISTHALTEGDTSSA